MSNVKALCFDTGGTILDWHTGMRTALATIGARHGIERDWARLANEFRRRFLKLIVNHDEHALATVTFDDAHRDALDQVLADNGLDPRLPAHRDSGITAIRLAAVSRSRVASRVVGAHCSSPCRSFYQSTSQVPPT